MCRGMSRNTFHLTICPLLNKIRPTGVKLEAQGDALVSVADVSPWNALMPVEPKL